MKLTLTTSFYNHSEFVNQLYENILSQTYKNWEWVVTDDFSSEETKSLLMEISEKDRRVRYVEQSKKKEMFYNPQVFCKDAEVIVQLDSDDLMLPKALETYHHFFTKFPEVILLTCFSNKFMDNSWCGYGGVELPLESNMSCGHLTFLRAWRNNRSLNLDFNPNDWMKYFYNDLSIVCKLEEHGKVLNLPRMLYHYTVRPDSISRKGVSDIESLREENHILITDIKSRRSEDFDSFERYFDPIYKYTKGLVDYKLNNTSECLKLSMYSNGITPYDKKLLRELFYDFNINYNDYSTNSDYNIIFIDAEDDLNFLTENIGKINDTSSGKTQIILTNRNEELINKLNNIISSKYVYEYYVSDYYIMNLIK